MWEDQNRGTLGFAIIPEMKLSAPGITHAKGLHAERHPCLSPIDFFAAGFAEFAARNPAYTVLLRIRVRRGMYTE